MHSRSGNWSEWRHKAQVRGAMKWSAQHVHPKPLGDTKNIYTRTKSSSRSIAVRGWEAVCVTGEEATNRANRKDHPLLSLQFVDWCLQHAIRQDTILTFLLLVLFPLLFPQSTFLTQTILFHWPFSIAFSLVVLHPVPIHQPRTLRSPNAGSSPVSRHWNTSTACCLHSNLPVKNIATDKSECPYQTHEENTPTVSSCDLYCIPKRFWRPAIKVKRQFFTQLIRSISTAPQNHASTY
jgi:hypothetical protein